MPWEYRYQSRRDFFIFHAKGAFSGDDLLQGSAAVASDPNLRPESRVFLDYSSVDSFTIPASVIETLNTREAVKKIRGKHAFLIFAPIGSLDFRRYLKALTSSSWFRLFESREEAYAWLNEGLPSEQHVSGGPWWDLADFDRHQLGQR